MNSLPPLPLKDGCLHIDNSILELFTDCWAKTKWNRLYGKVRTGGNAALDFGSAIHSAMEIRYTVAKDKPVDKEIFQLQTSMLEKWFNDHPVDEFERRNVNHAVEVVKRYNMKYQVEPFNVLLSGGKTLTEVSFAIPLYTAKVNGQSIPVLFCGKIDLPVSWNNKIIIIDHKTDSLYFGPQRAIEEQMCSNQPLGYAFAFEKTTGQTVEGFCINIIPTKEPPAEPRDGIDAWWESQFIRDLKWLSTTPNWRQDWLDSAISQIESFLWHYERGQFPMTGKFLRACTKFGGCPYLDLCSAPSPTKQEELLSSGLYKTNEWSPLKQTKTPTN